MSLIVKAAAFVTGRQWSRWHERTFKPQESQNQLLLDIVRRNRATGFGRDFHFETIRGLEDYKNQVPIGDYERLRPYVERTQNGDADVLTADPVVMFTMTSGSTGEPKLIPITARTKKHHRELTRLWYYRAYLDHPEFLRDKLLGLVSPAEEGRTPSGIPYGAASGLIYQSSPRWIQNAYGVPYEVSGIKDFAAKYYLVMRLALEQEISFFGTPNPSTIIKLVETAEEHKAKMIGDIHDGSISTQWDIPPEIRQTLASRLAKNPLRARQLEELGNKFGMLRPKDYWTQLKLIGCWKGGSVGVRLQEFARWFDEATPVRDLGYMASEAQMTLPIADAGAAGILDIGANFYEFVPEDEFGKTNAIALGCTELEEGKEYYLVLTTPGGLYRYDINDVVRVAGFYNRTPLLEFIRKGRDVTNITGEKLHVNQVIQALAHAQAATGLRVQHFHACADVAESRYAFSVELDGDMPAQNCLAALLSELDLHLRRLNIEYAQKRDSQRLGNPVLWVMRSGWFERKAQASLTRAARDVQFKAPLLSAMPEDSSELLFVVEISNQNNRPDPTR
jgi:GH3 auxin-responsive promoter